jgi:hypothetical protein
MKTYAITSTLVLVLASLLPACAVDAGEDGDNPDDLESFDDSDAVRQVTQEAINDGTTDPCGGEVCCQKGGKWEQSPGGLDMCCRSSSDGSKECISDPTAWPDNKRPTGLGVPHLPTDTAKEPAVNTEPAAPLAPKVAPPQNKMP